MVRKLNCRLSSGYFVAGADCIATLIGADLVDREFVARARERGAFSVLFRPIELDRLRTSIRTAHEVTFERRMWLSAREQESRSSEHSYPGFRLETVK
jgi:AmiR/NasT family two-component response regulator